MSARSTCTACCQAFSSTQAFDLHRVGSFTPLTRRCLSVQEMSARGLVLVAGIWQLAPERKKALASYQRSA